MSRDLISVIVPIHNGEAYLKECVESILGQTYQNLELLLLDDGSTDHTREICEEYTRKDQRVFSYSHSNCGVGKTRNRGLELAQGEYIAFVDADDFILPTYLEKLHDVLKEAYSEDTVVLCRFQRLLPDGTFLPRKEDFISIRTAGAVELKELMSLVLQSKVFGGCWRMLFPHDLIRKNKIEFENDIKLREDQLFFFDVVAGCGGLKLCDEELYVYRVNPVSVTASIYKKDFQSDQLRYLRALERKMDIQSFPSSERTKWGGVAALNVKYDIIMNAAHASRPFKEIGRDMRNRLWYTVESDQSGKIFKKIHGKTGRIIYTLMRRRMLRLAVAMLVVKEKICMRML